MCLAARAWSRSRISGCSSVSEGRTRLTVTAEMPIDESMKDRMTGMIQGSIQNIKELIEAET